MPEILIQNADTILTMDDQRRELHGCDILIRDGAIAGIGPNLTSAGPVVPARGCVVTPGLVNTHHHLFQTLTRAVPGGQDALLFGWLQTLYPIWSRFGSEEMFVSALEGVSDPEKKRKIIGGLFIDVFDAEAKKLGGADFLAQGTLYPEDRKSVV